MDNESRAQSRATQILNQLSEDPGLTDELMALVYGELRLLAAARMSRERPGQTIQATELVHEAYLRLVDRGQCRDRWASRAQFFKAAAEVMRRILIDRARRKSRVRHGGDLKREDLDHVEPSSAGPEERLVEVNEALTALAKESPRKAEIVKLRYFVGLTSKESADILELSLATVERDWAFAKAWLFNWLKKNT